VKKLDDVAFKAEFTIAVEVIRQMSLQKTTRFQTLAWGYVGDARRHWQCVMLVRHTAGCPSPKLRLFLFSRRQPEAIDRGCLVPHNICCLNFEAFFQARNVARECVHLARLSHHSPSHEGLCRSARCVAQHALSRAVAVQPFEYWICCLALHRLMHAIMP